MENSNMMGGFNNESSCKRLGKIMQEAWLIYTNSRGNLTYSKKKENKEKLCILFNEATLLFEKLQAEITSIDTTTDQFTKADASLVNKVNEYNDLLSKNTNFDETMQILQELFSINSGIPSKSEIFDNVEDEIMYEIQEVEH